MSEIKVEKVTLDRLSILQELSIQTFCETFTFDNAEENFNSFSMIVTL